MRRRTGLTSGSMAFDFADAEEMFRGALLIRPDTREDYGEERWIGIGMIHGRIALQHLQNARQIQFASSR